MLNDKYTAYMLLLRMIDDNKLYNGCKLTEDAERALIMGAEALKETDWIPVLFDENKKPCFSLPEENERILVSVNGNVYVDKCVKTHDELLLQNNHKFENIDAWKPLPEPYIKG